MRLCAEPGCWERVKRGRCPEHQKQDDRRRNERARKHGRKSAHWQHRRQFVANTRWWPPFCLVVDWVAATFIAVEIVAGVRFHH
jgi:hypothetical protein